MDPRTDEARRYRILDVVGEGGFGKVYRARLEGAEGFAKDVAIKLLTDAQAPEEVLKRFRDESRILGLIRDRAIVTVDPPTRLDGRWAVVMEFVDGANCNRLLRKAPIPPRAAVEIVGEVARALDNCFNQLGPDGEPLRLIHRDIKPSNIQVTPAGAVKILDFGIARASFGSRESRTTTHIGGTFGYIAPERLEGIEGAAGDVYSLGITLAAMLCGRRPKAENREKMIEWVGQDPDLQAVWDLAEKMRAAAPDDRPTAREVEDLCLELAQQLKGQPLRRWAEVEVQEVVLEGEDDLVGNVLTETMAYLPRLGTAEIAKIEATPGPRWPWILGGVAAAGLLVLVVLSMTVGAAGVGAFFLGQGATAPEVHMVTIPVAEPPRIEVVQAPVVDPVQTDADPDDADGTEADGSDPEDGDGTAEVIETPDPEPVVPAVVPVVSPAPRPAPRPPPRPSPVAREEMAITFGSVPFGAVIWVDGKRRGEAPTTLDLTVGRHQVRMERGDDFMEQRITVGKREPVKHIWKGGSEWFTYY